MIRPLCVIVLAGLAAPVLAQSINPAIQGEGSQTQTLEVLGGAVSVSVESGGALSLGRGDPQAGASATLSVNDLSVGVGNQNADAGGATAAGGTASGRNPAASPPMAQAQDVDASLSMQNATCDFPSAGAAAISRAIDAGMPVIIRHSDCVANEAAMTPVIETLPGLAAALDDAGTAKNRVVAITIADDGVIVYRASGS
ncbi:MAG: hypothetical protein ABS75_16145 [Pelagibacterium sp. SCN 63-23]|nr:MAG: hypothetical protein ABS75_16145 [Pelagibacterium sp. SCN 63-23]